MAESLFHAFSSRLRDAVELEATSGALLDEMVSRQATSRAVPPGVSVTLPLA
jgi:hypothetical protein